MLFTGLLVEDPVYVSRITLSCNADLTAGWLSFAITATFAINPTCSHMCWR